MSAVSKLITTTTSSQQQLPAAAAAAAELRVRVAATDRIHRLGSFDQRGSNNPNAHALQYTVTGYVANTIALNSARHTFALGLEIWGGPGHSGLKSSKK